MRARRRPHSRRRRAAAALLALAASLGGGCGRPAAPRALAVGDPVGALALVDLEGRPATVAAEGGHAVTVLWFWSTLCPCVRDCEERIVALLRDYGGRGLRLLAVDSNDFDDPARIRGLHGELRSPYPVLRDLGAREARRLGVQASASVAVIDREGRLRYRGAVDDDLERPTVSYVRRAVDALLAGGAPPEAETPSYGCLFPLP